MLLAGHAGPVLVLGMYHYVMPLDGSTLLIWNQRPVDPVQPTAPVVLTVVRPASLPVLTSDLEPLYRRMNDEKQGMFMNGDPESRAELSTVAAMEQKSVGFPPETRDLEELLVLCHSSLRDPGVSGAENDLALMVARPRDSSLRLYLQDWFNTGGIDYGYQWVTRVVRDPKTGRIHGDGIRIAPFALDASLRRLA
jgi:hypothetical protein